MYVNKNEANLAVRGSVRDGKRNGFLALELMGNRFNPRTPARLFKLLIDIFKPGMIKDARDVARGIEEWEGKISKLKNESGEHFSESFLVAVMISFLPKEFQDMVFQMGSAGEDLRYVEIRDKVVGVAGHRAQGSQPRPSAELNAVPWDAERGEEEWEKADYEIDALGKRWAGVKCHRCGGVGHMAKECGTPPGKGIEGMGKGGKAWGGKGMKGNYNAKGGGKGNEGKNGYGEKGKGDWGGKPQGYRGGCWKCGKTGHKQWECPGGKGVNEVGTNEAPVVCSAVELGGVWNVCEVSRMPQLIIREEPQEEPQWKKVSRRKKRTWRQLEDIDAKSEDPILVGATEFFIGAVPLSEVMEMKFQVCDVRNHLEAIWKICKNMNIVQFGPRARTISS